MYFRQLFIKSYSNSNIFRQIESSDISGFTEALLTQQDYIPIDSLTTVDNQRHIAESTESQRRAEVSQGKRSLDFIVNKLSGKWLDSLAKRRFNVNVVPDSWTN